MDEQKFRSLPSKVTRAYNIEPTVHFIDKGYELLTTAEQDTNPTGRLVVFRLEAKDPSCPAFVGRWDDGKRGRCLDVDFEPPDALPLASWKSEENGYKGHHTEPIGKEERAFRVDIRTPEGRVFEGEMRFNIVAHESVTSTVKADMTTDAKVS